ncbi:MAG: 6-phosphogluconolactonase [Porphyromonadaceae bacterium CG2_30_38_12]|nr:MAG: 6-phosphogluconolactonase [Porphyromonadaceae bacterium CG2_30_38_12]
MNSLRTINIFKDIDTMSLAVAELIKQRSCLVQESEFFNIAVSGGNTPMRLFQLLGQNYSQQLNWERIRLFWVDERCVEPTHKESNYGMTYQNLLQKKLIPETNVFRMHGEANASSEAQRYEHLLRDKLTVSNGFPVFDLILLGMGDDGHTASIFPPNLELLDTDAAVSVGTNPYSLQQRITLTGKTINAAKHVLFMITGNNKALIMKHIMTNSPEALNYPANYIQPIAGNLDFFLDEPAASQLVL